jgi:hypothetical protein
MLDSFEDFDAVKSYWTFNGVKAEASDQHATDGKKSLKLSFAAKTDNALYHRGSFYWGASAEAGNYDNAGTLAAAWSMQILFHDAAKLDVFNPQDKPVTLLMTMGSDFKFDLKPGANELTLNVTDMLKDCYRSTTILMAARIAVASDKPVTLFFDDFRLVGKGIGQNMAKSAKCFDCGGGLALYAYPGFSALTNKTAYSKEAGFGWQTPSIATSPWDQTNMMSIGSSGRQPLSQLIRERIDRVQSPLLVDLPDGKYRVQWVEGNSFAYSNASLACDYSMSIKVGDKVTPVRKAAKDFAQRVQYLYGRDRVDYLPGESAWRKHMSDLYSPWEADVESTGGQLKLEFLTDPPGRANLDYIIIYPVDKADVIEPELAAIWQDLEWRFNTLEFCHASPKTATAMNLPGTHEEFLDPAAAAQRAKRLRDWAAKSDAAGTGEKDLLVFARDMAEEVYPDTVPSEAEVAGALAFAGSPGETAAVAINLYTLRDLKNLKVHVGDFTGGGKTIKASDCDLRFVRYSYRMSGQQEHGDWTYMIMPWFMVKRDAIEMVNGMSVRWHLEVNVPADLPAGKYAAEAWISADGLPERKVPLALEVLPIKLDAVAQTIEFSTLWGVRQEWAPTPDTGSYQMNIRRDPAKAKPLAEEVYKAEAARTMAEFEMMRHCGLNFVYHRVAMDDAAPMDPLRKILPMVDFADKPIPGKSYVAGGANALKSLNEKAVDELVKAGNHPVLYGPPVGWAVDEEESGLYRFSAGFFMWRLGASGCFVHEWEEDWGDPYHPFDNHCGEWGSLCVPASRDWPTLNTSVVLEGMREGILDHRYIATLERLVKEKADAPAAVEAKAYLSELRQSIQGDGTYYFANVGDRGGWNNTWHQTDKCWKGRDYADARRKIAAYIAKLQGGK